MNTNVLNHFIRVKQEVKEPSFLYWKFIFFNFLIHFFRFLRPVAYRQYVRPVYEYVGTSKRFPCLTVYITESGKHFQLQMGSMLAMKRKKGRTKFCQKISLRFKAKVWSTILLDKNRVILLSPWNIVLLIFYAKLLWVNKREQWKYCIIVHGSLYFMGYVKSLQ